MTRVGREGSQLGMARGPLVMLKTKGARSYVAHHLGPRAITNLTKLETTLPENGQSCALRDPKKRVLNPCTLSLETTHLKESHGNAQPRLNHLRYDKCEPRQTVQTNNRHPTHTTVPRRLPRLHRTFSTSGSSHLAHEPVSPLKDLGFDGTLRDVFARIDSISKTTLFQQLDKPVLYDDKKQLKKTPTRTEAMEETHDTDKKADETNKQILYYIREREAALDEVKKIKTELTETQSKLYDALKLVEELEKKVPADKKGAKPTKKAPPPKKKQSAPAPKSDKAPVTSNANGTTGGDRIHHPPVDSVDPAANSRQYYTKLAEAFPTLPMMHVLDAEKKFMDADADNSGYIDKEELDQVLSNTVGLFTPKQVEEIFYEVDTNHSESVDFYEVLVILNKLHSKRRTNLPQSVQQNYSKTCNVQ